MAAREKKPATRPVAFRLTLDDYAVYKAKFEASGMSQSEFFRECVLANKTEVIARPSMTADKRELLRIFKKASNNINQIAYRANADNLEGKLSEAAYIAILEELEQQTRYLKGALANAN